MVHPLVTQLRFARSKFVQCLDGLSAKDACHRFEPMNCISWIVGHLADQENRYWVLWAQDREIAPGLRELTGSGQPASTPPLDEMRAVWNTITVTADSYLDTLTPELVQSHLKWEGKPIRESIGTLLLRNTYHYWFHLGEVHAIRLQLGHTELPPFVGKMSNAEYRPES